MPRTPLRPTYRQCTGRAVHCLGGYQGGYTGWVIPGTTQLPSHAARGGPQKHPAKRAPEAPKGLEWVGCGVRANPGTAAGTAPGTTLRARSGTPGPLPVPGPSECCLLAIWARFDLILLKVSQNRVVSPIFVEKACHSPYIPKRGQEVASWKSEISRFSSLLSQGINGPILTLGPTLLSK